MHFAYKPVIPRAFARRAKGSLFGFFRPWLGISDFNVPVVILGSNGDFPDDRLVDATAIAHDFRVVGDDMWGAIHQLHNQLDQDTRETVLFEIETHGEKETEQKRVEQEHPRHSTS